MPHHQTTFLPSKATEWIALTVIAIVAACVYGWIAAGGIGMIGFSDSADYLFFADFYRSQFSGQLRPEAVEFYRATRFPPLFPLLLAVFGGGTHDLQHTQVIACAITLWMFAMLWVWLRRETADPAAAATLTLLVVLSPGLFLLTLNPVSEPLAMGMTWLVLLLAANPHARSDRYLLLALIAGISTLARSANIALVAAIPVWLYFQGVNRRQWIITTTAAFVPFVLWFAYRRSIPESHSYLDGMSLERMAAELGGWPDLLYLQPGRLILGFAKNFDTAPGAISLSIAVAILICAAHGWWRRMQARRLDAVFLVFYLALILVWPFPREATRFMSFLLPLLLFYAWLSLQQLVQRFPADARDWTRAPTLLTIMVGLASITTIWHLLDLATQTVEEELRSEMRSQMYFFTPDRAAGVKALEGNARIRLAAREAAHRIPPGECVYATLPHLLQIHGPVDVLEYPALAAGTAADQQLHRCDYFFVVGLRGLESGQAPFYPLEQLRAWTTPIVMAEVGADSMVAALLVRDAGPTQ